MEKRYISLDNILKNMPRERYNEMQLDKRGVYSEWCVKKYEIGEKKYITISVKKCDEDEPIYMDTYGEVIRCHIDEKYEKYVKEKYYWYVKSH